MSRSNHSSLRATFHLQVAYLSHFELDRGVPCPDCALALDLHQPDQDNPDILLGSCPACAAWHLVEMAPNQVGVAIVTLPGGDAIRAAIKGDKSPRVPDRFRRPA